MKTEQAIRLGMDLASQIESGLTAKACNLLSPYLRERIQFPYLEKIGAPCGGIDPQKATPFLDWIADQQAESGWVIIVAAAREWLQTRLPEAYSFSRNYIIQADIWYVADIFGERVPGPALLSHYQPALRALSPWRTDPNRWVRRTVGVAVHFWAKRTKGDAQFSERAKEMLVFLEPMFCEQEMDAVKGIGWGLKTIGKHYPQVLTEWLHEQVQVKKRPCRTLMLRKALTWLDDSQRAYTAGEQI